MEEKKETLWSRKRIKEMNANWNIVVGMRSNGKTFQIKVFEGLLHFLETGKKFMYLRRTEDEIKFTNMQKMFDDIDNVIDPDTNQHVDIAAKFNERYPGYRNHFIAAYRGEFWVSGFPIIDDELGKAERIETCGCYLALVNARTIKSVPFAEYDMIMYDEFISDKPELKDEFSRLLNVVSTVRRTRTDFTVWLLANTISKGRDSVIVQSMNIDIRTVAKGDIALFEYYENGQVVNKVAVERCLDIELTVEEKGIYCFNSPVSAMIVSGEWETDVYPNFKENEFYRIRDMALGVRFKTEFITLYGYFTRSGMVYISDKRLITNLDYITLTNMESHFDYKIFNWKCGLEKIAKFEVKLIFAMNNGKIRYSDNLVGDDFQKVLELCNK